MLSNVDIVGGIAHIKDKGKVVKLTHLEIDHLSFDTPLTMIYNVDNKKYYYVWGDGSAIFLHEIAKVPMEVTSVSTVTQPVAGTTEVTLGLGSMVTHNGITISSDTITFTKAGIYTLYTHIHIDKTGSNVKANFWLEKYNTATTTWVPVPLSARYIEATGTTEGYRIFSGLLHINESDSLRIQVHALNAFEINSWTETINSKVITAPAVLLNLIEN